MTKIVIPDGGTIGSASDTDAIAIASDGGLTFSGGIDNAGTISAGTIDPNVTITDGASPHGWQHIGTKHYNTDTSPTDTSYYPLVNEAGSTLTVSSEFSAYKIYFQLSGADGTHDLRFRLMTGASAYYSGSNYTFFTDYKAQGGGSGNYSNSSSADHIFLIADIFQNAGSQGAQGEICIWNCYSSATTEPTIDGNQIDSSRNEGYRPYGYYRAVGHVYGAGEDQYLFGGFKINANQYITGFAFLFESDATMYRGSWHSIYGLKLA
tara:strand:+ start:13745 stop:14539 length:795 start_codon:yes stop_codon:yes gene_type:complete